ncbi:MAG: shikimate kinase [Planctomycetota bacterium]
MHLVLIGYRGSGKTSAGRAAAQTLGLDLVDLDHAVRAKFDGRSIANVWATEGEPAFRKAEAEAFAEQLDRETPIVLATGGGAVMTPDTATRLDRARAQHAAWCAYLHATADVLAARIAGDTGTAAERPSLTGAPPASAGAVEEVASVLTQRESTYRKLADVVIDATADLDQVAAQLVDGYRSAPNAAS